MRPLPDFNDVEAMAERGRKSAMYRLRGEACGELNSAASYLGRVDIYESDMSEMIGRARAALDRLEQLQALTGRVAEAPTF